MHFDICNLRSDLALPVPSCLCAFVFQMDFPMVLRVSVLNPRRCSSVFIGGSTPLCALRVLGVSTPTCNLIFDIALRVPLALTGPDHEPVNF